MNHPYRQIYNFIRNHSEHFPEIQAAGSLNELEALDVYRKGYFARVNDALIENFETIYKLAQPDNFYEVTKVFVNEHPSQEFNISKLSEKFIEFLGSLEIATDYPFLNDLAHLDWQRSRLFHIKDEIGLSGPDVLEAMEAGKDLTTTDSVRFFRTQYPLKEIRDQVFSAQELRFSVGDYMILLFKSEEQVFISQFSGGFVDVMQNPANAFETDLNPQEISEFFKMVTYYKCLKFQN
jgi:hypothetical protein